MIRLRGASITIKIAVSPSPSFIARSYGKLTFKAVNVKKPLKGVIR